MGFFYRVSGPIPPQVKLILSGAAAIVCFVLTVEELDKCWRWWSQSRDYSVAMKLLDSRL